MCLRARYTYTYSTLQAPVGDVVGLLVLVRVVVAVAVPL